MKIKNTIDNVVEKSKNFISEKKEKISKAIDNYALDRYLDEHIFNRTRNGYETVEILFPMTGNELSFGKHPSYEIRYDGSYFMYVSVFPKEDSDEKESTKYTIERFLYGATISDPKSIRKRIVLAEVTDPKEADKIAHNYALSYASKIGMLANIPILYRVERDITELMQSTNELLDGNFHEHDMFKEFAEKSHFDLKQYFPQMEVKQNG